jgi:hypothetical protein
LNHEGIKLTLTLIGGLGLEPLPKKIEILFFVLAKFLYSSKEELLKDTQTSVVAS